MCVCVYGPTKYISLFLYTIALLLPLSWFSLLYYLVSLANILMCLLHVTYCTERVNNKK